MPKSTSRAGSPRRFSFGTTTAATAAIVAGLSGALPAAAESTPPQAVLGLDRASLSERAMAPESLYGGALRFRIERDGTPVGSHTVAFSRDSATGEVIARSRSEIVVMFGFLPVYGFSYDSEGRWRDGRLVALAATTDDQGNLSQVSLRSPQGTSAAPNVVMTNEGMETVAAGLMPSTHWNAGVLGATQVLNTITGAVADVTLAHRGEEMVPTGQGPRPAHRFEYRGDIAADVWYDGQGRWVGLAFAAEDGSQIRYVCDACGPAESLAQRPDASAASTTETASDASPPPTIQE